MWFSNSLVFGFVGTRPVRSCSYEKEFCRGSSESARLVLPILSVLFMFCFCVSFVACLLYCLSHHVQGRVHDTDPVRGHGSDSSVGPGYYFFHPSRFSFLLLRSIWCSISFSGYLFPSIALLALSLYVYIPFPSVWLFLWVRVSYFIFKFYQGILLFVFLFLSLFPLAVYRRSWRVHVAAWHCTTAVHLVQRGCLCRSFVTAELVSV